MRFRNGTLHWNSHMPQMPMRQVHESPKRGDNVRAINRAKGRAFDANVNGPWWMHNPTPAANGYTRIVRVSGRKKGKTRLMTPVERRRHWAKWSEADILRWRRPTGERPLRDWEGLEACARVGALPIREVKYPAAGVDPKWFEMYVEHSKKYDVPAWFKTLPNMRGFKGKVALCLRAGGQIMVIHGGAAKGRAARLARTARVIKGWTIRPNGTW